MSPGFVRPLFCWRATKEDGVAHILGDVRVPESELLPLANEVQDAFEKATVLIASSPVGTALGCDLEERPPALCPEGERALDRLSPKTRKELEAFCQRTGFQIEPDCRLKPLFLADRVAHHALDVRNTAERLGLGDYLFDEAKKAGKQVIGLEGTDGFEVLAAMDENSQDHLLRVCLRTIDDMVGDAGQALEAWRSGDRAAMERLAARHVERYAKVPVLRLMDQVRAIKMAGTVAKALDEGGASFVLAGAYPLVGPEGLLERLRQEGANFEQMAAVVVSG